MDYPNQLLVQIAIDLALLAAIIIMLWRVNSNFKKSSSASQRKMTEELKSLIIESQANADKFLRSLEQSRLALKEIALELDVKEKRVKAVLEKSKPESAGTGSHQSGEDSASSSNKYSEVMNLINQGYSNEETARLTGCTQAEVGFIIDLSRIKNENA